MSLLLAALAGSLLGAAYTLHLWHDVQRLTLTRGNTLRSGMAIRLGGIAIVCVSIGRTGASNLIAALIGLLLARSVMIRRIGMRIDA